MNPKSCTVRSAQDSEKIDKKEKERRWKEENREALESANEYVRKHGLPLAKYRDEVWGDSRYWWPDAPDSHDP